MRRTFIFLAAFAFALAACGGGGGASPANSTVRLGSSSLGQILVDSAGRTLYGFTPDQAAGTPTCYEGCATAWPPLTVSGTFTLGSGLDQSKFKTATRTDGGLQLQFGEFPLYRYATDTGAGQTNGQGVGGKWFVIGANGTLIQQ